VLGYCGAYLVHFQACNGVGIQYSAIFLSFFLSSAGSDSTVGAATGTRVARWELPMQDDGQMMLLETGLLSTLLHIRPASRTLGQ
jgi:hypothetical protein